MGVRTIVSSLIIAFTGLFTLSISVYAFTQEISHFTAASEDDMGNITGLISGSRSPGIASLTQMAFLFDCRRAMTSSAVATLPAEQQAALFDSCYEGARTVTRVNPAWSFAWYSLALACLAKGDDFGMNANLQQSYSTGQNEGWVAAMRVQLVERYVSRVAPELIPNDEKDLALLAAGHNMGTVVDVYTTVPASKERITAVIEKLEPALQRQFLVAVKRQMASQSSNG